MRGAARDFSQTELVEATNYLNTHYAGLTIEEVRSRLKTEIEALRGEIATLMQAAVQAGTDAMAESSDNVVVSGERNLLGVEDFGHDMGSLRRLFDGLPARLVTHTRIFAGYDNLIPRLGPLARLIRAALQAVERTPLNVLGLSHLLVVEKIS